MKNVSWEDVAEFTGAEMVAGDLILVRGPSDREVLGTLNGTQFTFSEAGQRVAIEMQGKRVEEAVREEKAETKAGKPARTAKGQNLDPATPPGENAKPVDPDKARSPATAVAGPVPDLKTQDEVRRDLDEKNSQLDAEGSDYVIEVPPPKNKGSGRHGDPVDKTGYQDTFKKSPKDAAEMLDD